MDNAPTTGPATSMTNTPTRAQIAAEAWRDANRRVPGGMAISLEDFTAAMTGPAGMGDEEILGSTDAGRAALKRRQAREAAFAAHGITADKQRLLGMTDVGRQALRRIAEKAI